jgi:transposase
MLYLGIDQHHKQITVSIRDDGGTVIVRRQVSTQPDKIRAFLEDARREGREEGFMAVVEVCGFNDWLMELLAEFGCREIVLIHPEKRSKRKTDRRDASKLSELLWLNAQRLRCGQKPQGLRRVVPPSPDDHQDRQLTSLRKRLAQQQTRTINKIKNILRRRNLTWQQPTKTFQTQLVRYWLQKLKLSETDRLEMDHLLAQWALWEKQLEELEKRIADRFPNSRTAQQLNSPFRIVAEMVRSGNHLTAMALSGTATRAWTGDTLTVGRKLGPGGVSSASRGQSASGEIARHGCGAGRRRNQRPRCGPEAWRTSEPSSRESAGRPGRTGRRASDLRRNNREPARPPTPSARESRCVALPFADHRR